LRNNDGDFLLVLLSNITIKLLTQNPHILSWSENWKIAIIGGAMKRISALLLVMICLIISNNLHSSPYVENMPFNVKQPDRTVGKLYFTGSKGNYYDNTRLFNEDDYTIVQDNDTGIFCWTRQDSDGWLKPTGYAALLFKPKNLDLKPGEGISKERNEERDRIGKQTGKAVNKDGSIDLFNSKNHYAIGDTGPAGGIIFYDKGYWGIDEDYHWRYLEAAPATAEFSSVWGLFETEVSGTDTSIGSGQQNTDILVNLGDIIIDFIDGNGGYSKDRWRRNCSYEVPATGDKWLQRLVSA